MSAMGFINRILMLAAIVGPLAGCTLSGGSDDLADSTITTGSVPAPEGASDPAQLSDSRTVRNAVSGANLSHVQAEPVAWANTDTGTSGTITAIQETRAGDQICRRFTTSRRRYDGVALYSGEACTAGQGEWTLTRFTEGG